MRALIALIGLLVLGMVTGCSTTSTIMLAPARPPVDPSRVTLYPSMPPGAIPLAIVTGDDSGSWSLSTQGQMDDAVRSLKAAAGLVGANGVVIGGPAGTGVTSSDGLAVTKRVTGTAVWVP